MIPSFADAFADIRPEGDSNIDAARSEDRTRVARMLATDPARWSDEDIDLVAFRAMTTLGGPETFKWILPHFLDRSAARPGHGWLLGSETLPHKLDHAAFDAWPAEQRQAALRMIGAWLAARPPYDEDPELREWLRART